MAKCFIFHLEVTKNKSAGVYQSRKIINMFRKQTAIKYLKKKRKKRNNNNDNNKLSKKLWFWYILFKKIHLISVDCFFPCHIFTFCIKKFFTVCLSMTKRNCISPGSRALKFTLSPFPPPQPQVLEDFWEVMFDFWCSKTWQKAWLVQAKGCLVDLGCFVDQSLPGGALPGKIT